MNTTVQSGPSRQVSVPLLAAEGIRISFGSGRGARHRLTEVVHGVDLSLHAGQVLALVGESGSGKSVLANSILGLLPRNAEVGGSINLQGEQLLGASEAALRKIRGNRIGSVFQEPMRAFNPLIKIGPQISEAIKVHQPHAANAQRVYQLLVSVGLSEPERIAKSLPHQLSGGQLQRAMIAMAISCGPSLIIADEPTTALDVTVQAEILELLRHTKETLNTAILLITHDMGVVADLADDVVVLREGAVVERAPVAQLFAAPQHEYTRMLLASVPRLGSAHRGTAALKPQRPGEAALVELDKLTVRFGGARQALALDEVSLSLRPGEVLGLVGESGSGKTTLGKVLAGLQAPSSGSLKFQGVELAPKTLRSLRRSLGFVFQDPASSLNPRHLLAHSIAEPLRLHSSMNSAQRRTRVRELLEAVQLPSTMENRYPHQLSGGQRQRAALARALALQPQLLIADEPTSALDVSVQARIIELLRELQDELNFGCLFISHDLAVVEQLAHRVAVLRRGQLVEVGPVEEVLNHPEDPYTRRLLAAAPVPDPEQQSLRRRAWSELIAP
ncbi:dipeptide ABC transporter ATP-binding protein [Psychromicrobium sp. YIM B11713]|uniref:dipeptide ABC transporter ATP-binding protein n=1 Tax=Psychromicrobium sp. YIM B11713 TaxID=3145233 RepID=UPI00374E20BD